MKKQVIFIRLDPKTKNKIRRIAEAERRDMTSLMLFLIDKKIKEVQNARTN